MRAGPSVPDSLLADINVTPLVDVMLVLLIIFMVTAPLIQQGVDVDLPQAKTRPLKGAAEPLVVTLSREGQLYINDERIAAQAFPAKMKKILKHQPDRPVYLRADGRVPYQAVMKVIAELKEAGASKLGMVTQPPETSGS